MIGEINFKASQLTQETYQYSHFYHQNLIFHHEIISTYIETQLNLPKVYKFG